MYNKKQFFFQILNNLDFLWKCRKKTRLSPAAILRHAPRRPGSAPNRSRARGERFQSSARAPGALPRDLEPWTGVTKKCTRLLHTLFLRVTLLVTRATRAHTHTFKIENRTPKSARDHVRALVTLAHSRVYTPHTHTHQKPPFSFSISLFEFWIFQKKSIFFSLNFFNKCDKNISYILIELFLKYFLVNLVLFRSFNNPFIFALGLNPHQPRFQSALMLFEQPLGRQCCISNDLARGNLNWHNFNFVLNKFKKF